MGQYFSLRGAEEWVGVSDLLGYPGRRIMAFVIATVIFVILGLMFGREQHTLEDEADGS